VTARGRSGLRVTPFSRNQLSMALLTCSETGTPSRSLIVRKPSISRSSIRSVVTCVRVTDINVYQYMAMRATPPRQLVRIPALTSAAADCGLATARPHHAANRVAPLLLTPIREGGTRLYELACERDLEVIVAKWAKGSYQCDGLGPSWLKIKNCDYSQMEGRHDVFEAKRSHWRRRGPKAGAPALTLR